MATPRNQLDDLVADVDDVVFPQDLDQFVKTEPNTSSSGDLIAVMRQAADRLPEEVWQSQKKKSQMLMLAIKLLQRYGDLDIVAYQLFPEGVTVTYPKEDDQVFEPMSASLNAGPMSSRDSERALESDVMRYDLGYVPESLRGQAGKKTTKVYETMLWVRQGEVGKIKSVVIKPKGYAKPFQIICAQLSRSVTRWADVELQPPDGEQNQAQVMTRFDEKAACFARIICFNKDVELTSNKKFDVAVDGTAEAFIVEARTYVRDFVGNLPVDKDRKPIDLVLGVGKTWLSIPLVHQSADRLIARCVIDAGRQLDTIPIHVDATDVRKQKIRTFLRQPQNHDWLLSWEPEEKKGKGRARRGDGTGAGGHGGYPSDSSDDSDEDDNFYRGLRAQKRRKADVSNSRVRSTLGSFRDGNLFRR